MKNTDNPFFNTFLIKRFDEELIRVNLEQQQERILNGAGVQLKTLWKKFRTTKFEDIHSKSPLYKMFNPEQKKLNCEFAIRQDQRINQSLHHRVRMQNSWQKTFNKTKIDLEHNFTGKKYLKKIQQQRKRIKTEPTRQLKGLEMYRSNILTLKKASSPVKMFMDDNSNVLINRHKSISPTKMQIIKKRNSKQQTNKKRIRVFKNLKRRNKTSRQGDQIVETTKKLLKISTQLNEQQQKALQNRQKIRFKQLMQSIKIQPWQKSSFEDILNGLDQRRY